MALIGENSGRYERVVVEGLDLSNISGATEKAHFWVSNSKNNPPDPAHDEGAGAHGAGFFGDVEGHGVETLVSEKVGGLCDGENFGMRSGVSGGLDLVVGGSDDFTIVNDDGPDGDLVLFPCLNCLIEGEAHEELVVAVQLGWILFFEGTVHGISIWVEECLA